MSGLPQATWFHDLDAPGFPERHLIEHHRSGDRTEWRGPNAAGSAVMLRGSGFAVLDQPQSETLVCRRVERPTPAGAVDPCRPQDGATAA